MDSKKIIAIVWVLVTSIVLLGAVYEAGFTKSSVVHVIFFASEVLWYILTVLLWGCGWHKLVKGWADRNMSRNIFFTIILAGLTVFGSIAIVFFDNTSEKTS